MKHLILAGFLVLLAGCLNTEHEVSGDVGVAVDYASAEIKMVNGILYVRKAIGGITSECISIDASALYDAEWGELKDQNLNRTTPYMQEELDNCL